MEHAITYKDVYLSLGEVISIDVLTIQQSPNQHGELTLSAVLDNEPEEMAFYEMPETVTINYMEKDEEKILFKGTIADSRMERIGNHRKVWLKAYDATWGLDNERKTRSFQNISRTSHSVIEEVMKGYPGCICMKNIPNEAIGQIWFQYEETDWEFLCRFASHYSDSLYADATYQSAHFQAGLSAQDIDVDWDKAPYQIGKDLGRYDYLSQNGFSGLGSQQFIEYFVDSYGIYTLGSKVCFKGRTWYISSLKRSLKEGLMVCTYELRQKEAMLAVHGYNQRITGISVDGKITQVNRDKVRVSINVDTTQEQGTYWFPFSTVAASADGSGWYSMPEIGDSIRVYFPTKDEKEGYVITKHDSHMPSVPANNSTSKGTGKKEPSVTGNSSPGNESSGYSGGGSTGGNGGYSGESGGYSGGGSLAATGGATNAAGSPAAAGTPALDSAKDTAAMEEKEDPMDDPSKRNIFTKDGNVVQMVSGGVILKAGNTSVALYKNGNVNFVAPSGVTISAGKSITINGKNVALVADTMIKLEDESGAEIVLTKETLNMKAKEIYEN